MTDVLLIAESIHDVSIRFPTTEAAWSEIARLANALHKAHAHPDFEYCTTECGRKAYVDLGLEAQGWEENITDGDPHSSWERFDYTEDHYWRRHRSAADTGAKHAD